jgi:hypothetical protein
MDVFADIHIYPDVFVSIYVYIYVGIQIYMLLDDAVHGTCILLRSDASPTLACHVLRERARGGATCPIAIATYRQCAPRLLINPYLMRWAWFNER